MFLIRDVFDTDPDPRIRVPLDYGTDPDLSLFFCGFQSANKK
jgi:hypothetical protein